MGLLKRWRSVARNQKNEEENNKCRIGKRKLGRERESNHVEKEREIYENVVRELQVERDKQKRELKVSCHGEAVKETSLSRGGGGGGGGGGGDLRIVI